MNIEQKKKIDITINIMQQIKNNNPRIGGSCCLFVLGLKEDFNDVDIIVDTIDGIQFDYPIIPLQHSKRLNRTLKYNIDGKYIEFEITENELFDDLDTYIKIINDIHSIGAKVSMDDFGSGNTSLNILTKYNFDFIKLDKSFFKDKSFDENTKKSLKTIITLAHELGKQVVAEGVETEAIDKFLKSINCDIIQGFYYSKPMSFDEYIKYIKK